MSSTLHVTVSLLHGPTKAAVATVLGAGLASSSLFPRHPAQCLSIGGEWSKDGDSVAVDGVVSSGKRIFSSYESERPPGKKLRPIGSAAVAYATSGRNVALTGFRNVGLSSLIVLNGYLQELYDEEERAQREGVEPKYPPFPWPSMSQALIGGTFNACVDFTTQLVRLAIDWAAAIYLPYDLSCKLRKDLRASALRKERFSFWWRGPRVMKTAWYSEATFFAADWTVTCALECYTAMRWWKKGVSALSQMRRVVMRCFLQACRCVSAHVATSFGLGLGSMLPRRLRPLAMLLAAQAMSLLVNFYFRSLIARLTTGSSAPDHRPPGSGGQLAGQGAAAGSTASVGGEEAAATPSISIDQSDADAPGRDLWQFAPAGRTTPAVGVRDEEERLEPSSDHPSGTPSTGRHRPRESRVAGLGASLPRRRAAHPTAIHQGAALGSSIGVPGPDTPQAPREPRQLPAVEGPTQDAEAERDREGEGPPMPPETPPMTGR